jgi:hypothetical protein
MINRKKDGQKMKQAKQVDGVYYQFFKGCLALLKSATHNVSVVKLAYCNQITTNKSPITLAAFIVFSKD